MPKLPEVKARKQDKINRVHKTIPLNSEGKDFDVRAVQERDTGQYYLYYKLDGKWRKIGVSVEPASINSLADLSNGPSVIDVYDHTGGQSIA